MNDGRLSHRRHIIGLVMLAFVILVVVGIGTSVFFAPRPFPQAFSPFSFFRFGWFFGLFWILIIFWAVRWLFWPRRWGYGRGYWGYGDESYYILRQRYARGEITKEQLDQMMRDLREHS